MEGNFFFHNFWENNILITAIKTSGLSYKKLAGQLEYFGINIMHIIEKI